MQINTPLSDKDNAHAIALATKALQDIGAPRFVVAASLDVARPWTVNNFMTFGRVLLDAYKAGFASGLATNTVSTDGPATSEDA